jgi:hypothetical protein
MNLGPCTMPGCASQAFWVHGIPLVDEAGNATFPWRLCNCCQESVLAADQLLRGDVARASGICEPDFTFWGLEAARVELQLLKRKEAK